MAVRIEIDEAERQRHRRDLRRGARAGASASSAPPRSRSAATRSSRPGCCCTRRAERFPHGLANAHDQVGRYVMVQGATQVAGRFPELLRMYKAPPPEVSSEQFYETDERARLRPRLLDPDGQPAPDRLGRARARRRPSRRGPARVHARLQPLGGARLALRAAAAAGQPRHARRRDRPVRDAGRALRLLPVRQRPREHRLREGDDARDLGDGGRAGRAHDRPLRPPRRRLPDGTRRRDERHRLRPPRLGRPQPVRLRRQRDADAGKRQSGAHDHGARLAPRRAPRERSAWPALVEYSDTDARPAGEDDR